MIKISVIVPIYNISTYIDQCVESIVAQTYKNLEIILVNDGSKDDSLEKIKNWERKDKRIIVIDKSNGGLSDARNAGLKIATGDYVSFVDGDDWISTNLYEKIVEEIELFPHIDIITFSIKKVFPSGKSILLSYKMPRNPIKGDEFFRLSKFYVNAWSKIYRREFVKNRMFVKGLLHEDIPYTVPAVNDAAFVGNIEDAFYCYRQDREGSILNTYSEKKLHDWLVGMKMLFNYAFDKHNVYLNCWILERVVGVSMKAQRFENYWKEYTSIGMEDMVSKIYKTTEGLGVDFFLCVKIPKLYIRFIYYCHSLKNKLKR